jgi:hypothetical protein
MAARRRGLPFFVWCALQNTASDFQTLRVGAFQGTLGVSPKVGTR